MHTFGKAHCRNSFVQSGKAVWSTKLLLIPNLSTCENWSDNFFEPFDSGKPACHHRFCALSQTPLCTVHSLCEPWPNPQKIGMHASTNNAVCGMNILHAVQIVYIWDWSVEPYYCSSVYHSMSHLTDFGEQMRLSRMSWIFWKVGSHEWSQWYYIMCGI